MAIGFMTDDLTIHNPIANLGETSAEPAAHVTGKPTEREPLELALAPTEAPEAGETPAEAPDAGYGRCTESSDWEERGRNWS